MKQKTTISDMPPETKERLDDALVQTAYDLLTQGRQASIPEIIEECSSKNRELVRIWMSYVHREHAREEYVRDLLKAHNIPYGAKRAPSKDSSFPYGSPTPSRLIYPNEPTPFLVSHPPFRRRLKWLRVIYPVGVLIWVIYLLRFWPVGTYISSGPSIFVVNPPPPQVLLALFLLFSSFPLLEFFIERTLADWRKWRRCHPEWEVFIPSADGKSVGLFLFTADEEETCQLLIPPHQEASWKDWAGVGPVSSRNPEPTPPPSGGDHPAGGSEGGG